METLRCGPSSTDGIIIMILMKKESTFVLFNCLAMLSLVGCQSQSSSEQNSNAPKVCTEISPAARDKLVLNASKIQIGDQTTGVEALLGVPDKEWPATNKQGDRTIGTEFYYFTRKCGDSNRVFDEDHFVRIRFDLSGQLISISAHNVDGVSNRPNLKPGLH